MTPNDQNYVIMIILDPRRPLWQGGIKCGKRGRGFLDREGSHRQQRPRTYPVLSRSCICRDLRSFTGVIFLDQAINFERHFSEQEICPVFRNDVRSVCSNNSEFFSDRADLFKKQEKCPFFQEKWLICSNNSDFFPNRAYSNRLDIIPKNRMFSPFGKVSFEIYSWPHIPILSIEHNGYGQNRMAMDRT